MLPVCDVIPSQKRPVVTLGLIAVTTLVFLYELQLDRRQLQELTEALGVVPAAPDWPALVTSLFMQSGWVHFGGNMLCLWLFGGSVEDALGHGLFLMFYLSAGVIGALAHVAFNPTSATPLIGASSAVAGVMGTYFMLYPGSQVLTVVFLGSHLEVVEVPAIFFLGFWAVIQFLGGLASLGVQAHAAVAFSGHLAGLLIGIAAGLAARRTRRWK